MGHLVATAVSTVRSAIGDTTGERVGCTAILKASHYIQRTVE